MTKSLISPVSGVRLSPSPPRYLVEHESPGHKGRRDGLMTEGLRSCGDPPTGTRGLSGWEAKGHASRPGDCHQVSVRHRRPMARPEGPDTGQPTWAWNTTVEARRRAVRRGSLQVTRCISEALGSPLTSSMQGKWAPSAERHSPFSRLGSFAPESFGAGTSRSLTGRRALACTFASAKPDAARTIPFVSSFAPARVVGRSYERQKSGRLGTV